MESLQDLLFGIFQENWNNTNEKQKENCVEWTEFYNHWIDLMKSIISEVPETVQMNSLLVTRFLDLNRDILWSLFATMVGSYESAVRECRFWMEAFLQAYLTDIRGGISKLSNKIERTTGSRLINECGFSQYYQDELRRIYSILCKYVHPTRKELNIISMEPRNAFYYDEELFNRNRHFFRITCDAILFIVMDAFPDATAHYIKKPLVIESLQDSEFNLSLRFITENYA